MTASDLQGMQRSMALFLRLMSNGAYVIFCARIWFLSYGYFIKGV